LKKFNQEKQLLLDLGRAWQTKQEDFDNVKKDNERLKKELEELRGKLEE